MGNVVGPYAAFSRISEANLPILREMAVVVGWLF
jgi:hypothetical protein